MTVKANTYVCDWPECGAMIVVNVGDLLGDEYWERRGNYMHVCPDHRYKSYEEVVAAATRADPTFVHY